MSFGLLLNSVCDVEERTLSHSVCCGEQEESWSALYESLPCRLQNLTAEEKLGGNMQKRKATHKLYMEHRIINPELHRIVISGQTYNIVGFEDMGGASLYAALILEKVTT